MAPRRHALALAAAAACLRSLAVAQTQRPNVIFVITDDQDSMLGATDVMPNYVRRFAGEGMQMVNAFVGSPKCCPSRTSLLSGRFTHNLNDTALGWCGDFLAQDREDATFFGDVKAQGYRMGFFGKMINNMGPMCTAAAKVPRGFDVADGDAFYGMCNEVVYYENTFNVNGALFTTGHKPSDYLMSWLGNRTVPWLATAAKDAAAGGKPFFAYLAPHAPHFPAEPAPWYADAPLPSERAPRLPSYNALVEGKHWSILENAPFDTFTEAGIDLHFRNRQRSLISYDDFIRDVFATLEEAGALDNTYVFATSDHGYHLGEYRIPFEKSNPYDIDVRVPFYVRGPGVPAGGRGEGMVSLMDVGATVLELTGATQSGQRTTDGRSLVPILGVSGVPPPGAWRNGLLIEHLGEVSQWMSVCGYVFNASCANVTNATDRFYLIDGPQNTWAQLRVVNATHDFSYTEFRPLHTAPAPNNTNFTELFDLRNDPWQGTNIAPQTDPVPYAAELWAAGSCSVAQCP